MTIMKLPTLLLLGICSAVAKADDRPPVIYDSDYGPFVDDVFALGLLLQSEQVLDVRLAVATSDRPELSALCIAAQMKNSLRTDIPVAVGASYPAYELRGGVCAMPGKLGFAMEPECRAAFTETDEPNIVRDDGIAHMARMLLDSNRTDWMYIAVGGQSSLKALIEQYPDAAAKLDTVILMGGNWCSDIEPYPEVFGPTDETNIACDPGAANIVLDGNRVPFRRLVYVPVEVAHALSGADYRVFLQAAHRQQPVAAATLDWYRIWSKAGRADPNLLVHAEAMKYDPETESTPQFDAMAVQLALDLAVPGVVSRMALVTLPAVHFADVGDDGMKPFPEEPRVAFSFYAPPTQESMGIVTSKDCPSLSPFTFDPADTPEQEYPVQVALGFVSPEAQAELYRDLALRLAGRPVPSSLCANNKSDQPNATTTDATESSKHAMDNQTVVPPFALVEEAIQLKSA